MSNMKEYKGLYAFHPGYFVKQIIDDAGYTQDDFAIRLGVSSKVLSELVNGKTNLSREMAQALSSMLGISVEFWLGLQAKYTEKLLEIENLERIEAQKPILKLIDYKYFVQNVCLENYRKAADKVKALCTCLKISNLDVLTEEVRMSCYRISSQSMTKKNAVAARAWLFFALAKGSERRIVGHVDTDRLLSYVDEIRGMTIQGVMSSLPRIEDILSSCGVTFIYLPMLKEAKVSGAVKWSSDKQSVTLAINDRSKMEDVFWFTLLHEIRHVIQRSYNRTYVSLDDGDENPVMDEQDRYNEQDADAFAQNILIPQSDYQKLLDTKDFSTRNIYKVADRLKIHPGIIAGRLAKDHFLDFRQIGKLRRKFSFEVNQES